jgi:hypothetical protein
MTNRNLKDEIVDSLKRKGWKYVVKEQETLTHPDGHFHLKWADVTGCKKLNISEISQYPWFVRDPSV